ncbi:MAG: endonuclease/exonuclease/phosphatase family protein [Cyanobacteria bacterium J06626_6]
MPTVLFWNLNRRGLTEEVSQLCRIHSVDILVLAEAGLSDLKFQRQLSRETGSAYIAPYNELSSRIRFFFRYPSESIRPAADSYGLSIREIRPPLGRSVLIAGVHLSSKRHADREEQLFQARDAVAKIAETEENLGHSRTLVIGDFNMNPFEGGLVDADSFHGVMTMHIAQKQDRNVRKMKRKFFYNPMWSRMGDGSEGPAGTYYYQRSRNREFFWHTFDQALIRPALLPSFRRENLKILTAVGSRSLLTEGEISSGYSDHLPIMIELTTELEGL